MKKSVNSQNVLQFLMPLSVSFLRVHKCDVCGRSKRFNLRKEETGIKIHGVRCCSPKCFELAVEKELKTLSLRNGQAPVISRHRLPLGLLLLSHGVITRRQLESALEMQRINGRGRIGEWLQRLGYADEREITRALSIQCGRPMINGDAARFLDGCGIPAEILTENKILPVHYRAENEHRLYLAGCNEIDPVILSEIEQMLGCTALGCIASESIVKREIERARTSSRDDIVFETPQCWTEMTQVCLSYALQLGASEMRTARCGAYLWIRLKNAKRWANLLFRIRTHKAVAPA